MIIAYIAAALIGLLGFMFCLGALVGLNSVTTKWPEVTANGFACLFGAGLLTLALHVAGLL
jgi:hypothetical protein